MVKEIWGKIADEGCQRILTDLLKEEKIEDLIEHIQIYADSVATNDESDDREIKAQRYLSKQKDKLTRCDNRRIEIPEAHPSASVKFLIVLGLSRTANRRHTPYSCLHRRGSQKQSSWRKKRFANDYLTQTNATNSLKLSVRYDNIQV